MKAIFRYSFSLPYSNDVMRIGLEKGRNFERRGAQKEEKRDGTKKKKKKKEKKKKFVDRPKGGNPF